MRFAIALPASVEAVAMSTPLLVSSELRMRKQVAKQAYPPVQNVQQCVMQYWQASMFITQHAAVSAFHARDAELCQCATLSSKSNLKAAQHSRMLHLFICGIALGSSAEQLFSNIHARIASSPDQAGATLQHFNQLSRQKPPSLVNSAVIVIGSCAKRLSPIVTELDWKALACITLSGISVGTTASSSVKGMLVDTVTASIACQSINYFNFAIFGKHLFQHTNVCIAASSQHLVHPCT